jgi:hypothetical protein
MRLPPIMIASIASGMPWPRIFSDPKRAIRPMISPPTAGANTIQRLGWMPAKLKGSVEMRPRQTKLEVAAISLSSTQAPAAPPAPATRAMAISIRTRRSAVKSPSS